MVFGPKSSNRWLPLSSQISSVVRQDHVGGLAGVCAVGSCATALSVGMVLHSHGNRFEALRVGLSWGWVRHALGVLRLQSLILALIDSKIGFAFKATLSIGS